MKRHLTVFFCLFAAFFVALGLVRPVLASETDANIVIVGNGSVTLTTDQGSQTFTQSAAASLSENVEVTLSAVPADGYALKTLTVNGQETDRFVSGDNPASIQAVFEAVPAVSAAPATLSFSASKVLEGGQLQAGQFSFTLSKDGQVISTVQNQADGSILFPAQTFTAADAGKTFIYAIKEVQGNDPDIVYDGRTFMRYVTVTEEDGQVALTQTCQTVNLGEGNNSSITIQLLPNNGKRKTRAKNACEPAQFVNTKIEAAAPARLSLSGTKVLTAVDKNTLDVLGNVSLKAGQYSFRLSQDGNELAVVTNDESGNFAFPDLIFTQDDVGMEYEYVIEEIAGNEENVVYDRSVFKRYVSIGEEDGQITANVSCQRETGNNSSIVIQLLPNNGPRKSRSQNACAPITFHNALSTTEEEYLEEPEEETDDPEPEKDTEEKEEEPKPEEDAEKDAEQPEKGTDEEKTEQSETAETKKTSSSKTTSAKKTKKGKVPTGLGGLSLASALALLSVGGIVLLKRKS